MGQGRRITPELAGKRKKPAWGPRRLLGRLGGARGFAADVKLCARDAKQCPAGYELLAPAGTPISGR